MERILPDLPYTLDALAPSISKETMEYHYGKHHQTYVDNLNKLQKGTEFESLSLEDIITKAPAGGIYNNAAQVWNHTFFWSCMKPNGGGEPSGALAQTIQKQWGDYAKFKADFAAKAAANFGSGWTYLAKKADGSLEIQNLGAAGNPLKTGDKPVLIIDVWEHAYYIDYRNARVKFIDAYLNSLVNWDFAAKNFG